MGLDIKSCSRYLIFIGCFLLLFGLTYFTIFQLFCLIRNILPKTMVSTFGHNEHILIILIAIASYMILCLVLYLVYECLKCTRKKNPQSKQIEEETGFRTEYLYDGKFSFLLRDHKSHEFYKIIDECNDDVEKQINCEDAASTTKLFC